MFTFVISQFLPQSMQMEIETVQIDMPVLARIYGFFLRYAIRFVELPFLFAVFFVITYIITTIFNNSRVTDVAFTIFLYPLATVLKYPEVGQYQTLTPILVLTAFWLLIFHTLWELLSYIFKKRGLFSTITERQVVVYGLWSALLVALLSTALAHSVPDRWLMAALLLLVTLIGQFSYWVTSLLLQISKAFITGKK